MKVALIAIAKHEEDYINEWLAHYISLGFDKFIIGDNNESNYEHELQHVIKDCYREYVLIIDCKDKQLYLFDFYQETYFKEQFKYDWIAIFDIDEFLMLYQHKNIKDFLALSIFDNADLIMVNWRLYDDNDLIYNDSRPVVERFTRMRNGNGYSTIIKSIYRGSLNIKIHNSHSCCRIPYERQVDVFGNTCKRQCGNNVGDYVAKYGENYIYDCYKVATLNHYNIKTISEFYQRHIVSDWCSTEQDITQKKSFDYFFKFTKATPEKLLYIRNARKQSTKDVALQSKLTTVAVICCAKMEENYIIEFVKYYKKLGVNHIFIADNNDSSYEHLLSDILKEYVDSGFITVYD